MYHSLPRAALLSTSMLAALLSQGCDFSCDVDNANMPVGASTEHEMIHVCRANVDLVWDTPQGSVNPADQGQLLGSTCGVPADSANGVPNQSLCTTYCEQVAAYYGATVYDCTQVTAELFTDATSGNEGGAGGGGGGGGGDGQCHYMERCEPADYPPPGQGAGLPPASSTVHCLADPAAPMNVDPADWGGGPGQDFDPCPGCIRYAYTAEASDVYNAENIGMPSGCGYLAEVQEGQSAEDACHAECGFILAQHVQHDYPTLEDNCSTMIVNSDPVCAAQASVAPFRENIVWETANGPVVEPMECDDCCDHFGPGVCERLRGAGSVTVPVEQESARMSALIHLPNGTVRRGYVDVDMEYLHDVGGEGTSPLYIDELRLDYKPSSPIALPASPGVLQQWLYRVTAQTSRPLIAAHHSTTAAFQVLPGSANVTVLALVGSSASTAKQVTLKVVTKSPLRGWLVPGQALLLDGELEIAPGARVVF